MILKKNCLIVILAFITPFWVKGQFLMDMVDTTTETGRGMLAIYKKYDRLKFSGYIQPQFQLAEQKGISSYEGGNFGARVSNRFMLRRSRVRIDYVHFKEEGPGVQFVFQFDINERRVTIRDVWGRVFENKFKLFSLTTGMFARPFGYETNLSSSNRESPERGRMNQALMKSERDLGAMLSLDARNHSSVLKWVKLDLGVFNGQGINADADFDNRKDFIGRLALKPIRIHKKLNLSSGISVLAGGLEHNTRYVYRTGQAGAVKQQLVDSSLNNIGSLSPRNYYGADVQLKMSNGNNCFTELRAEYIRGTQTGTASSNETPSELQTGNKGFYIRQFNGAYFYFTQHLASPQHQLIIKYDWYDPNTRVKGKEIGAAGSNFSPADIKYHSLGLGYIYYISPNVKSMLYYAMVRNEGTALAGYTGDVKDNVLTMRLQFQF